MKAQGIISDIVLNVRRGKQHFTVFELWVMTLGSNPGLNWFEFEYALKLTIATGEVKSTLPFLSAQFNDCAILTPGSAL